MELVLCELISTAASTTKPRLASKSLFFRESYTLESRFSFIIVSYENRVTLSPGKK